MKNLYISFRFFADYIYVPIVAVLAIFAKNFFAFILLASIPYLVASKIDFYYQQKKPQSAIPKTKLETFLEQHIMGAYAVTMLLILFFRFLLHKLNG